MLTTLALRAERLGGSHAWRFYHWVRLGALAAAEGVWWLKRRLGVHLVGVATARAAQAAVVAGIPEYPFPGRSPGGVSPRAEEILRGAWVLDNGDTVPLAALSWKQEWFGEHRSIPRFLFNSLHGVAELVEAHRATGETRYLDRAKELVQRWMSECLWTERDERVWDDHATALRALGLCQLWLASKPTEPDGSPFMRELMSAILRHGDKLANSAFYRPDHDHGITQAYALLAIGLMFPMVPEAETWSKLGHSRLERQMSDHVSAEGIYREHSPYYHFFIFRQFYYAYRFTQEHGAAFSETFAERLQAMLSSGAYLLKPDGTLPGFGDTSRNFPLLVERHDLDAWPLKPALGFRYSWSGGAEGTPPEASSVVFPGGGCAVFRSGWGTSERFADERFLIFRLSTFPTTHIHRDVFGFELYAYGDDLIVDSGGPAYEHPIRKEFLLSTAAHNTVVVDDQDQAIGEAEVLHWEASREFDFLDTVHRLFDGVSHRRALVFVRPDYFIVLDRLEADRVHRYSQLFHLSPALQVSLADLAVCTENPSNGPTVQIVPLIGEGLGLRLHRGALSPRQGWVYRGSPVANAVVEYQQAGATVTFATLVLPDPPGRPSRVSAQLEGSPFETETRIRVEIGTGRDEIVLSPSGILTVERSRNGR